ncbi:MAG: response regulator [Lachnospiraceae bacterium]|nr:response regulator [Lachnospiraceae bacterium]
MNDNSVRNLRNHNTVVWIITVACIGTIAGSTTLEWELWVHPLIIIGLIATWVLHLTRRGTPGFRENYYLIFTMLLSFYHGVHPSSFYDIYVISALLMVNVTLFRRKEFIVLMLVEFFFLTAVQIWMGIEAGTLIFDKLTVSRITLHIVSELCVFKGLSTVITNYKRDGEELERRDNEKEMLRSEMEDFLVNISHELRTPVNVINGMSTLILKEEERKDVIAIRDAGLRLSSQIEDIQDYSEIQRGGVVLEEDRYMITSILNDIAVNFRVLGRSRDQELVIYVDPDFPAALRGDARKIRKIIRHLLDNAFKFTPRGGIFLRVSSIKRDYGINLIIEVTDTGIGMSASDVEKLSAGLYQVNKRRNRSTGGIGLGLSIVYGFARAMKGFVTIDSKKHRGTTVKVSIAQEVLDPSPCLSVTGDRFINMVIYMQMTMKQQRGVREFYRRAAADMAAGLRINLYFAADRDDLMKIIGRGDITHIFTGEEEYSRDPAFFDELAEDETEVAVLAKYGFSVRPGSRAVVMTKPFYCGQFVKLLSESSGGGQGDKSIHGKKLSLEGLHALVVDDEPMNLVVASGLFKAYRMVIDTAESGKEAIEKYRAGSYDLVFMDHMMPEMDGVEAMKRLREVSEERHAQAAGMIALTANAISGARDMFLREGFDGFISKPVDINDFERVVASVINKTGLREGGRT